MRVPRAFFFYLRDAIATTPLAVTGRALPATFSNSGDKLEGRIPRVFSLTISGDYFNSLAATNMSPVLG